MGAPPPLRSLWVGSGLELFEPLEHGAKRRAALVAEVVDGGTITTGEVDDLGRFEIDADAIAKMKPGVMLINTSRGAVVDSSALIGGLKSGALGSVGLDVYEEEADLFFEDLSQTFIRDDVFARLLTFPNVLITGHQGFFTREALKAIAETTIANITAFERDGVPVHPVPMPGDR